jgi:hypothetical protein
VNSSNCSRFNGRIKINKLSIAATNAPPAGFSSSILATVTMNIMLAAS